MRPVQVSNREADVLAALGEHRTNAQIASSLHLSVRTVEGYISSLLRKYGATDRRELAALAETVTDNPAVVLGGIAGFPPMQTSFVGRGSELAAVATALDSQRLVTLHGSGGVGKTRLAVVAGQAAADTFPFGGAFVDLVPARDVVTAIAGALDVSDGPNRTLLDAGSIRRAADSLPHQHPAAQSDLQSLRRRLQSSAGLQSSADVPVA